MSAERADGRSCEFRAECRRVASFHADRADLNAAANTLASVIGPFARRGAFASAAAATREFNAEAA